jgi:glutamine synthetase
MLSKFARTSARSVRTSFNAGAKTMAVRNMSATLDGYGDHLFKGAVAAPYLTKHGLAANALDTHAWTTDGSKDKVAAAVLDWAKDNGASTYTHWFQPIGASMVRWGLASGLQNMMVEFNKDGTPAWDFDGKALMNGETDGSSYVNGGLRATHTAGGYLSIDPTSPIFLRGDTIFIPACLTSYYGYALDEKTPLLRASDALSREGARLLNNLGYKSEGVTANIGLEQEIFLVPRSAYLERPDLQLSGRTVMGKQAARGQEMCDHYMAPLSLANPALACMQEIQDQCWRMGIPLKTRHREVAPNQFEFAPLFGSVTTQIDQNLMVMQIIEETAAQYGLAALLQEKPFAEVNGSGKHNNWSIANSDGTNLLNVGQLAEKSGNDQIFPVIMAAIVKGIHDHGDLMRLAIATPGNDFRLGACEAPPAIMSTYLGEQMTDYLKAYTEGEVGGYVPDMKSLDMGASVLAPLVVPAEDRNRTSPFPYGGHRFEFRAVGSAQNVSIVNTVLATITAKSFKDFSNAIESGKSPKEVATQALRLSWKCIFNGDNYDEENQKMLTDMGVWRIDSGVEANKRYTADKNVALFGEMGVFSPEECEARQNGVLDHYAGTVEIEALCMIDMINQHVIPSVKAAGVGPLEELHAAVDTLKAAVGAIHAAEASTTKAELARVLRLETMIDIREHCDAAEAVVPANLWTLATYKDLLFLDQTTE